MRIRPAEPADNAGLLRLTALAPMAGEISIRIDRQPDFFRLLNLRGRSHVLVAEEGDAIVGCISAARVVVHVDGEPEPVHYLGDLKTDPAHRGGGVAARLARSMHRYLVDAGADLVLWTAAYGNAKVLPFFDGRAGLPRATPLGLFRVHQLLPRRGRPAGRPGLEGTGPDLLRLYADFYRSRQFGPMFDEASLREARHLVARSGPELAAAVSLVDVSGAKQNVLLHLPVVLEASLSILRRLRPILPLPNVPRTNAAVRVLYVKACACRPGQEARLDRLFQAARAIAFEEGYHFLAVGLHERDGLARRLANCPKFTFKSLGFVVGLRRGPEATQALTRLVPHEDYSLV